MGFIRENILKIITIIIVLIVAILIMIFAFGNKSTTTAKSYPQMEENLKSATKKYVTDNQKLLPKNENETTKINLDTLVDSKYIKELYSIDDSNVKCNGYVSILKKNSKYKLIPYIKCGKYYETVSISNYIKKNDIVTSGDGLYEVGNKYIFKGENPKNYISIGNRLYRIIEIDENDELRLITVKRLNYSTSWDNRYNVDTAKYDGINDYSISRIKDTLQLVYDDSSYFSEEEKNLIVPHSICIGKRYINDTSVDGTTECSNQIDNQYVTMINASEYMRASIDSHCNSTNTYTCSNYNYFNSISTSYRTITAVADNSYQVYSISKGVLELSKASSTFTFYPIIYIDRLSLYVSGNGTQENPYMVR